MDGTDICCISEKKDAIRKEMAKRRRLLTDSEVSERSRIICDRFLESIEYKNASSILLYKSYNNEVDTDRIFFAAVKDKKNVAYPVSEIKDGEPILYFFMTESIGMLKPGYKGILEPDINMGVKPFSGKADICVTPGLAFDKHCHRIGYGKAFYDRFIRQNSPKCVVGLAYDLQVSECFETEENDRPVDMVITESAVYRR